jgi:hypothetical protein
VPVLRTTPIYTDNPGALPAQYVIPGTLELVLQSIVARFNGAAAASSFLPTVSIYTQDGRLVSRVRTDTLFAVGDTGVVTFGPFLRRSLLVDAAQAIIAARIENHGGQAVANATNTTRDFDFVAFATTGMVDLAADNSIITITRAGTYLLIASANYAVNAVGRRLSHIFLNGYYGAGTGTVIASDSRQAITDAGARTTATAIALYVLAVGDFVSGGAYQASGGALTEGGVGGETNSFLSVARIGA